MYDTPASLSRLQGDDTGLEVLGNYKLRYLLMDMNNRIVANQPNRAPDGEHENLIEIPRNQELRELILELEADCQIFRNCCLCDVMLFRQQLNAYQKIDKILLYQCNIHQFKTKFKILQDEDVRLKFYVRLFAAEGQVAQTNREELA